MLLMVWLVLTTGVMLINIDSVLVVFISIFMFLLDITTITKIWNVLDALAAPKRHTESI